MTELLNQLANIAPVVAVLVVAIFYFLKKETGYKKEIDELNAELRKQERESLELMSKLTTTIDKFLESDSRNKHEVITEIRLLKETLTNKIDSLK